MIKTARSTLLLTAAALSLAACATSTPYKAAERSGYGFTEQKIEEDRYRITFRGNSLTDRTTVENFLLLRSAEVALQNGYDHFIVVEDDTERSTSYRGTSYPVGAAGFGGLGYGYYGYGRAFPYYGFGFPWGAGFNDVDIRPRDRYTAVAYVVFGEGQKPEGLLTAYDASEVARNLRPLVDDQRG